MEMMKREGTLWLVSRLNAIKNLPVIAKTLGPERTRSELIPYLTGFPLSYT